MSDLTSQKSINLSDDFEILLMAVNWLARGLWRSAGKRIICLAAARQEGRVCYHKDVVLPGNRARFKSIKERRDFLFCLETRIAYGLVLEINCHTILCDDFTEKILFEKYYLPWVVKSFLTNS